MAAKIFPKISGFSPQIYLPVEKIKKRGVFDGLTSRADDLMKMLKNEHMRPIPPPPGGGEGRKGAKTFFSMFLYPN